MPERVTTIDFPLGALFRRLAGNLMIVVVFVTAAIGLTQFDAVAPRPSAAPEFSDPPGSGLIVRSEVIRLWVPETLVDPARHEFPALVARTHQELKKVLERRGQENLWYAITVRAHQANHRAEDISFIRYPYRQPENLPELMDVLTAVAGSPRRASVCGLLRSHRPHRARGDVSARMARGDASIVASASCSATHEIRQVGRVASISSPENPVGRQAQEDDSDADQGLHAAGVVEEHAAQEDEHSDDVEQGGYGIAQRAIGTRQIGLADAQARRRCRSPACKRDWRRRSRRCRASHRAASRLSRFQAIRIGPARPAPESGGGTMIKIVPAIVSKMDQIPCDKDGVGRGLEPGVDPAE